LLARLVLYCVIGVCAGGAPVVGLVAWAGWGGGGGGGGGGRVGEHKTCDLSSSTTFV